ncbi:MAG: hypothetical protein HON53_02300 [Planctomycetaceae bacterium]|jgi:hypothetical protein|nr:hypothetical protein [Planctomycetaceae bacterium]MBT6154555.1 hypothetical protein [Planctomycetaceae bacterium]MBT6486585.1 hypothetical protein [Planctomycetaceae bacterium]
MSFLPIQAIGALAAAAPVAEAVIEGASATFAGLLNVATSRGSETPAAESGKPGLGLEGLNGGRPVTSAGTAAERLRTQTELFLQQFHQLLAQLLEENDIDAADGFTLQADELGQIRVTGGNGESLSIEELFTSNPELRQLFDKIIANASLLKSLDSSAAGTTSNSGAPSSQTSNGLGLAFNSEQATVALS